MAIHGLLARHGQVAMAGDGANNGDAVYPGIVPRRGVSLFIHTLECYPSRLDADDCSLDFRGWPFPNPGQVPAGRN